eukprot:17434-Prymnesium_polylepis.1
MGPRTIQASAESSAARFVLLWGTEQEAGLSRLLCAVLWAVTDARWVPEVGVHSCMGVGTDQDF